MLVEIETPLSLAKKAAETFANLAEGEVLIRDLFESLGEAEALAMKYDRVRLSIQWNRSKASLKKSVRHVVDRIVFDLGKAVREAGERWNHLSDYYLKLPQEEIDRRLWPLARKIFDNLMAASDRLHQSKAFKSAVNYSQLELALGTDDGESHPLVFPQVERYVKAWDEQPDPSQPKRFERFSHRAKRLWKTLCGQQLELDLKSVTPKPTVKKQLLLLLAHLTYRPARTVAKVLGISQNRRKSSLLENIRQEIQQCSSEGLLERVMEKMRPHLSDTLIEAVAEPAW